MLITINENKYPFNKKWNTGVENNFTNHRLPRFSDRLYKARQMEEMWLSYYKEKDDYWMVKKCERNIIYLDTKIAFEDQNFKK